jgi:hypothetical protein
VLDASGGVASRTVPDALDFVVDFEVDFEVDVGLPFTDETFLVAPFEDALDVRFADGCFFDGPQVDMTPHTVPRGCHTRP